jgi:hypothetical protein
MRPAVVAALAGAALLAAPALASAATPDLQIVSIHPSRDSVPVGIATKVTFVVYVRNDGEATTGRTGSIGPVGGGGTFTNIDLRAANFGQDPDEPEYCDPPGGESPRCRMQFLQREQTQVFEFTDRVVAPAVGTITRTFTADVLAPDTEGNGANNRVSVTLQAVPGALPTISKVALRGRAALTAKQRKRAVGKLALTLNRPADLKLTVERRNSSGKFRYWGEWDRQGYEGSQTILLSNRIDYRHDPPINFLIRRMVAGTYRVTIVADDAEHKSKPVRRVFVVPRGR